MEARILKNSSHGARRVEFWWLCALILSFYYELSLVELTSFDRVNPRLFDIVFIGGVVFVWLPFKRRVELPIQFRKWAAIVATFTLCSLIWTICWLSSDYGKFSLFFAFKYIIGLCCIYMVVRIPLCSKQKNIIHHIILVGGIFVGTYAVWEYFQGSTFREIAGGKKVFLNKGTILGPLGHTYFHISMISTLSFSMAASMFMKAKNLKWKLIYLGTALIGTWPAFFCGSRVAVISVGVALVWIFSASTKSKIILIIIIVICVLSFEAINPQIPTNNNLTFSRFQRMEDVSYNTVFSRITLSGYELDMYRWQGWLIPFIGAGFGVAPHSDGNGDLNYRVGYGIHNCYLYAFEQGGIVAFVLFISFLRQCWRGIGLQKNSTITEDRVFAIGMSAFFVALLCASWTGQVFWLTSGTENLTIYIVILLILANKKSVHI